MKVKQTESQTDEKESQMEIETDRKTDVKTDSLENIHTGKQTDRRQTDRQKV